MGGFVRFNKSVAVDVRETPLAAVPAVIGVWFVCFEPPLCSLVTKCLVAPESIAA